MKKLLYLLPLLMFVAGCMKTDTRESTPLVPYGTFSGKFTRTHTDPVTLTKTITTANVQVIMAISGFTVNSEAEAIHANSIGEFLGNELTIEFTDSTYPTAAGPGTKAYLHGNYSYTFDGSAFRLIKPAGDNLDEYQLVKQ